MTPESCVVLEAAAEIDDLIRESLAKPLTMHLYYEKTFEHLVGAEVHHDEVVAAQEEAAGKAPRRRARSLNRRVGRTRRAKARSGGDKPGSRPGTASSVGSNKSSEGRASSVATLAQDPAEPGPETPATSVERQSTEERGGPELAGAP